MKWAISFSKMTKTTASQKRIRKPARTAVLKRTRRVKPVNLKPVPSVRHLIADVCGHVWRHKKTFGGILLIYVVLSLIFVKALSSSVDIASLKDEYGEVLGLTGFVLNSALVADVAGNSSGTEIGGLYQTIILIITTLASIWLFRQTATSKQSFQIREPFYRGMAPLIPFLLILIVIGVQLLPLIGGVSLFNAVQTNGLATTGFEVTLWAMIGIGLAMISFYFLSASTFALIIVTLPDVKPLTALRSAKKLVAFRRWVIMRRLFSLIVLTLIIFFSCLLLTVWTVPVMAEWVALLLGGFIIIFLSGFGYKLYRALL
jgi:hypothetical protein